MRRTQTDWRMVALGAACVLSVCLAVVFVPKRQAVTGGVMDKVSGDIYRAVSRGDKQALSRARERLRRAVSDDLLGRSVPGMLRVVDSLEQTSARCDPGVGRSFDKGICFIRRQRFDRALLAFASVPPKRGGELYRDVAVRLMTLQRGARPPRREAAR